ncbi:S26 family signal peptidase [Sediminitomix flava]|uniref:Uncharacterized protein n=1 Tax=Sediminitomix flava TaxID=379075 RepID=A0A315ZFN4_SEDFL|nr:S26 family signal peptidase [Sediminitomix flava]PWJ43973.1 hypothetical protein BC781_101323 [Sediminitomix flava]
MNNTIQDKLTSKSPIVAGLLSFFLLDLGFLYLLEFKKWLAFRLGIWALFLFVSYTGVISTFSNLVLFILTLLFLKIIIIIYTINLSSKESKPPFEKYNNLPNHLIVFLFISIINLTFISPSSKLWSKNHFSQNTSSDLSSALTTGDFISWEQTKKVKTDDIIVFKRSDSEGYETQRCTAIAGDKIEYKINSDKNIDTKFTLPFAGMTVTLNEKNILFYSSLIRKYELINELIIQKNNQLVIGNKIVKNYTFKNNYYFTEGVYSKNNPNSFFQMPIPEYMVCGKALYIWWSSDLSRIGYAL